MGGLGGPEITFNLLNKPRQCRSSRQRTADFVDARGGWGRRIRIESNIDEIKL